MNHPVTFPLYLLDKNTVKRQLVWRFVHMIRPSKRSVEGSSPSWCTT